MWFKIRTKIDLVSGLRGVISPIVVEIRTEDEADVHKNSPFFTICVNKAKKTNTTIQASTKSKKIDHQQRNNNNGKQGNLYRYACMHMSSLHMLRYSPQELLDCQPKDSGLKDYNIYHQWAYKRSKSIDRNMPSKLAQHVFIRIRSTYLASTDTLHTAHNPTIYSLYMLGILYTNI